MTLAMLSRSLALPALVLAAGAAFAGPARADACRAEYLMHVERCLRGPDRSADRTRCLTQSAGAQERCRTREPQDFPVERVQEPGVRVICDNAVMVSVQEGRLNAGTAFYFQAVAAGPERVWRWRELRARGARLIGDADFAHEADAVWTPTGALDLLEKATDCRVLRENLAKRDDGGSAPRER